MWSYVIPHFSAFLRELELTPENRRDADAKAEKLARSLFSRFYPNLEFNPNCYLKVGSYGKGTACSVKTDLDMLFILPEGEYWRAEQLAGNGQSQLLQDMKEACLWCSPSTNMRADGQIVKIPFKTYHFEVAPAFRRQDGSFITLDTHDGGTWRISNPVAEYQYIHAANQLWGNKATHLTQMLKAWKHECNVPLKSISLEVFAVEFLKQWPYRNYTIFYYDWMIRDCFQFMLRYVDGRSLIIGTQEWIDLGTEWETRCRTALTNALNACDREKHDFSFSATFSWRAIFGSAFQGTKLERAMELA